MSEVIDHLQHWLVSGDKTSRRRFLIQIGRAGFGTLAALAGLGSMSVVNAGNVLCCNLSWPTNICPGYTCPTGCNCYVWYCCINGPGTNRYACGECNSVGCSFYYRAGTCPALGPGLTGVGAPSTGTGAAGGPVGTSTR